MAKKPRWTGRNFAVIRDETGITLGTLADKIVVFATATALAQDIVTHSGDLSATLAGATGGEGPIMFGVCDPNLTVTEVKEALEASPVSQHDYPAVEQAKRPVRIIGTFQVASTQEDFNDGKPRRFKLRLRIPAGMSIPKFWAYNKSGAALTTGATITISAKHYGSWQ